MFSLPSMDRNHKVLSTVGKCIVNTETDCEKCPVLQIPVKVYLVRFLCPSREDAKVRKPRIIYFYVLTYLLYLFFLNW